METEIKLTLDPASRPAVESHPAFAAASSRSDRELTTYYDTPALDVRRRGASLRVRKSGRRYVQTVKAAPAASGAGAMSREEWEWPLTSGGIDAGAIAAHPGARQLLADVVDATGPVFVTRIKRTRRLLELDGGTRVEAVIDDGLVRAGDSTRAICEVELELEAGPPAPLFRLAAELAGRAALRLGVRSKAERGYELLTGTPGPDPSPRPVALARDATLAEAVAATLGATLGDFVANLDCAERGDVEGVHRLRAAVRKLRTLLVLFAPALDRGETRRFNGLLRDFGAVLGRSRDWDVFLSETLPAAGPALGAPGLVERLREWALPRAGEARAAVRDAIAGPTPTDLVLGLSGWSLDHPWRAGADPDKAMRKAGPELLGRLARKADKRARTPDALDPEGLHGLRKALKKVRYGAEDLESLFKAKAVETYLKACKKVLQGLGEINDAAVTVSHLDGLSAAAGPDIAAAAAALRAWNETRRVDAAASFRTSWRKFRDLEPFWT